MIFTLISILVNLAAFSQTSLYVNPDFANISNGHKIIGIMPFKASVKLRPKQMKEITFRQLVSMERAESKSVQEALYLWFKKREKKGMLTVKVQDPVVTNVKLKKEGITVDNYEKYSPIRLAEILGVDAVLMGTIETNKPMSKIASLTLGVLARFYGKYNKTTINFYIYNAEDGELLVNYNKGVPESRADSTDDLINVLMINASRRIAYTKK